MIPKPTRVLLIQSILVAILIALVTGGVVQAYETLWSATAHITIEGTGSQEIWNWYDLDAIRYSLSGSYVLMNDLDPTTAGYMELASPDANDGQGFRPIGSQDYPFLGTLDGNGYLIEGLHIYRPDQSHVGLFGYTHTTAQVTNVGLHDVEVSGSERVGALAGTNRGVVTYCYSDGHVSGSVVIGGLIGWNYAEVNASYSTATVTSEAHAGGLVGYSNGPIYGSHATGEVTGAAYVGGLLGNLRGQVDESCATGNVTGSHSLGGLIGYMWDGQITDSYATGSVTGDAQAIGGLVGSKSRGSIHSSYAQGSVTGVRAVGGLVGAGTGLITGSYAIGAVSGVEAVGGFIGSSGRSYVSSSFAGGSVMGIEKVGGFAGWAYAGLVSDSYATGIVSGEKSIGGFVGYVGGDAMIARVYSIGIVTGNLYVGGLVGWNMGEVEDAFWDTQTSGIFVTAGGTGKTTAEMQDVRTFSDPVWSEGLDDAWNIAGVEHENQGNPTYIWNIVDGQTYPFLNWEQPAVLAQMEGGTSEVNCSILSGVTLTLYQHDDEIGITVSDEDGHYTLAVPGPGEYTVVAGKVGFGEETQAVTVADPDTYTVDFVADRGLIPNVPEMSYVLACINLWQFGEPQCKLSMSTVLRVINAWQFPVLVDEGG